MEEGLGGVEGGRVGEGLGGEEGGWGKCYRARKKKI